MLITTIHIVQLGRLRIESRLPVPHTEKRKSHWHPPVLVRGYFSFPCPFEHAYLYIKQDSLVKSSLAFDKDMKTTGKQSESGH